MNEMDHTQDNYSGMTETIWVKNKKAILRKLAENKDSLRNYREKLQAEKKELAEETERLEQENYSLLGQVKDLEMQHLEKSSTMQKLNSQLHASKKKLVKPLTEESGYLSEIKFLESEKASLFERHDEASETLNNNMAALGSTIMEIEFIKGEIGILMNKIGMIEDEIPEIFGEIDDLDEKITWASKTLTDLYNRMKTVEKDAKILYYEKE
jgi:chromosome segregation ATPase